MFEIKKVDCIVSVVFHLPFTLCFHLFHSAILCFFAKQVNPNIKVSLKFETTDSSSILMPDYVPLL